MTIDAPLDVRPAVRRLRTHISITAGIVALLAIAAAVTLARISQRSRRLAIELTDRNTALQDAIADAMASFVSVVEMLTGT